MQERQCSTLSLTKQCYDSFAVQYNQFYLGTLGLILCIFHSWGICIFLLCAHPHRSEGVYMRGLNQRWRGWIDIPVRPQGCCWRLLSSLMWMGLGSGVQFPIKPKAHIRVCRGRAAKPLAGRESNKVTRSGEVKCLPVSYLLMDTGCFIKPVIRIKFHTFICDDRGKKWTETLKLWGLNQ